MNAMVEQRLIQYASMTEEALAGYLPQAPQPEQQVVDAMAYSLLGGGKRIRAALVLGFYQLFGGDPQAALPFAGALEMIHAYSLIHDDLPCMDDDDIRRGKPSCHIAFGEANALLAGDALLTLAFELITNPAHTGPFAPHQLVRAVHCLSAAAGSGGMIGGQVVDLYLEGKETTPDLLRRMIDKKTGALIKAGGILGCILGGAGEQEIKAAEEYCGKVGLAFQIVDDILDVTSTTEALGKPVGSDEENQKNTWVSVFGLEQARSTVIQLNRQAKAALRGMEGDTSFLEGLADKLAGRKR